MPTRSGPGVPTVLEPVRRREWWPAPLALEFLLDRRKVDVALPAADREGVVPPGVQLFLRRSREGLPRLQFLELSREGVEVLSATGGVHNALLLQQLLDDELALGREF